MIPLKTLKSEKQLFRLVILHFTKLQSFLTPWTQLEFSVSVFLSRRCRFCPTRLLLGLPSFACICSFLQPHIRIAHPLAFAGFRRFVASKNQFVRGKKVSRPRGRDGVVLEKGKSVCDPLRVRADLSEGGVTSNLDERVILCNEASRRGHYFPLYSPEYAN